MDETASPDGFSFGAVLRQVRKLWPALLGMAGVLVILGTILVLIYYLTDVNPHHLVADPHEIVFLPEYVGMYSYAGVLLLWTAGVVSLLTGVIVRGQSESGRFFGFHITLGILLCMLAADDLFMLHEWAGLIMAEASGAEDVGFERSRLEGIVFIGLGLLWLAWFAKFWRAILRTEYVLLGLGMMAFGGSLAIDMSAYLFPALEPESLQWQLFLSLLEEMFKLTGIFLMLAYVSRMSAASINQLKARNRP